MALSEKSQHSKRASHALRTPSSSVLYLHPILWLCLRNHCWQSEAWHTCSSSSSSVSTVSVSPPLDSEHLLPHSQPVSVQTYGIRSTGCIVYEACKHTAYVPNPKKYFEIKRCTPNHANSGYEPNIPLQSRILWFVEIHPLSQRTHRPGRIQYCNTWIRA
jgi:hypothetical protein